MSEPGATTLSIAAGPYVGPVLRRVVGMLAARADLPIDRLDDAVLVADLIADRAPAHLAGERLEVRVDPGHRSLTLWIGPLRKGGADALVTDAVVPGVGNVIERLTDTIEARAQDGGEHLQVCLAYPDSESRRPTE